MRLATRNARFKCLASPAVNKRIAENTALGRAGLPEDLGPMIASLLSEENRWVNAQRIEVAGRIAI